MRLMMAKSGESIAADWPLVIVRPETGGPRIAALNEMAEQAGLTIGEKLSDAHAKAGPLLEVYPLDEAAGQAALRRLALWAMRYTPSVAPWTEADGGDGLFLDITGCAHLFGGEHALLADLVRRFRHFGIQVQCAIAGTPGMAWAVSHFHPLTVLTSPKQEREIFGALPIAALRLTSETRTALQRLGFKRIGMLMDKERAPFAARFERELLLRIDQAFGSRAEALAFIAPPPVYESRRQFMAPVFAQDFIIAAAARLMEKLAPQLMRDDMGARRLRLALFGTGGEMQEIEIAVALPICDAAQFARLLALKLDNVQSRLEFGVDMMRLSITHAERLKSRQGDLAPSARASHAEACTQLLDALRQRLGFDRIRQFHAVERHLPEQSEQSRPAGERTTAWSARDENVSRPLFLLPQAEAAEVTALIPDGAPRRFFWRGTVHNVAHAQGPERIAPEWWRGGGTDTSRDYYLLENESGHRFWLYRDGVQGRETAFPKWYVHGFFA